LTNVSGIELIVRIIVAVAAFWLTCEFLTRVITSAARRAGVSHAELRFFKEGIRVIFMLLAIVAVIHLSGLTSEFTALTFSGIVAIALSLALQTTLSNTISGILLLLDNTLRINDSIEYGGIKGEVVKLGLRNSWIKTGDGKLVIIANSQIANGPLINYTAGERLVKKLGST
jgi:small conductance mechanosensitive channel